MLWCGVYHLVPGREKEQNALPDSDPDLSWLVQVLQRTRQVCGCVRSFPAKTALVLGREKQGIPPHVLDLLDSTVEIPQVPPYTASFVVCSSPSVCTFGTF